MAFATSGAAADTQPLRVLSLDQCADQYALALAPDAALALSPRADDPDSWMREAAMGRPRLRPTLEAAVVFQPDVVVRYWGGDPRLLRALEARGTRVLQIADSTEFAGIEASIRTVASGLGKVERGERLVARMRARLAPEPERGSALYLTSGGFTAGSGTLVDAILKAAGFSNATAAPGYGPVSVEHVVLRPPARLVLGFFDQIRGDWRGAGRHPAVRRRAQGRVAARLPAATLTCPAWFAAEAVEILREPDR